jgi:hypothetical protein
MWNPSGHFTPQNLYVTPLTNNVISDCPRATGIGKHAANIHISIIQSTDILPDIFLWGEYITHVYLSILITIIVKIELIPDKNRT